MHPLINKLFVGDLNGKRVIRSLLLIPIFVYLGILGLAWFLPNKLLFRHQTPKYADDQQIVKIPTVGGERISAKYYENPTADFTILFSHGNAEDIGNIDAFVRNRQESGFSVLSYDYRGYGTSGGVSSEENCYQDIDAAYKYLTETRGISPSRIILHGRSLGGGVSVDLAARREVGGLIMESTFTSASRVLLKYKIIPFDKFQSIDKIGTVSAPVLVIHGREDWTIPFHHGESLFGAVRGPKYSFWVDNAGHNNLFQINSVGYLKAIKDFSSVLPLK